MERGKDLVPRDRRTKFETYEPAMTFAEIAECLGITVSLARLDFYNGMKKLRKRRKEIRPLYEAAQQIRSEFERDAQPCREWY